LSRTVPRGTQAAVRVRSDDSGEFGERVRDAPMGAGIAREFVVAAPNILHQRGLTRLWLTVVVT
jgi:hypothetical protein